MMLLLVSCASKVESPSVFSSLEKAELLRATRTEDDSQALNISISVFEGESLDGLTARMMKPVAFAESRYIPYLLKQALEESGFWGAVRVVPQSDPTAELILEGRILFSDGFQLRIHLLGRDSLGRTWLDKIYQDQANAADYPDKIVAAEDPFQDLYVRMANDLALNLQNQSSENRSSLVDAALLRYAQALSPETFSRYLNYDQQDQVLMLGLPARDDPMYKRVRRIRESEYEFIDSVDEQYQVIFNRMKMPYAYWRKNSFEFEDYNRRLAAKSGQKRPRVDARYDSMLKVYRQFQDRRNNEDELRQMVQSFDAELSPLITRVEGQLIQLVGSLEGQYESWRNLLRQLYRLEQN
jgi:hypothetical protein